MKKFKSANNKYLLLIFLFANVSLNLFSQNKNEPFLYGDALPDAPELAKRGDYKVGVRTIDFVNKDQVDILKSKGGVEPKYDRPLKVEIWYPAALKNPKKESIIYDEVMGTLNDPKRPLIPFTFNGRAARNATPIVGDGAFPLIIVSHGYVGSRFLMTYLTENLASKGYIVAALDHTDATFRDAAPFQSTLLNRSKDVLFLLNELAKIGKQDSGDFFAKMIDTENTAIIGYSMGGYGALNVAGAGYSEAANKFFGVLTGGSKALEVRSANNSEYLASSDSRIKAVVAFAPWGMERSVWDKEGLKGLKTPTLFVAGSQDDISGYEKGIKLIYENAVSSDRYLLTYMNARHNVAPNPAPPEALAPGLHIDEYYRYNEPSWDMKRINNINQHFVTAFLGLHLKKLDYKKYLDLKPNSNEKTWMGFKPRSSTGLELLHNEAIK
jgi:predicted dienelactone hydrolase